MTDQPPAAGPLPFAPKHPPSDGAHRLAWWLALDADRIDRVAPIADEATVERWLRGEVEPAADVAEQLAALTTGAVLPDDWTRGGPLGWADKPFDRN